MILYKVTTDCGASPLITPSLDDQALNDGEVGTKYEIEIIEMTKAAYEALAEFSGF